MKIDWLIHFQTVVSSGSFSKAAENLYISQSSLSKNIIALENELGNKLFDRKSNKVVLTPYGQYISSYIGKIIDDYRLLNLSTSTFELSNLKSLKMAIIYYAALSEIFETVIHFESAHPEFYIETVETSHSKMLPLINSHQVDICFGYSELLGEPKKYDKYRIFSDPLVFVSGKKHASERKYPETVTVNHIKKERFCFPREDIKLFDFIISYCSGHDFRPRLTLSNVRLETIRRYIMNELRCTIYPYSVAKTLFPSPAFVLLPFEDKPSLEFCMYVSNKNQYGIKNALVSHVKETFSLESSIT